MHTSTGGKLHGTRQTRQEEISTEETDLHRRNYTLIHVQVDYDE